jgi:hypothetical protein
VSGLALASGCRPQPMHGGGSERSLPVLHGKVDALGAGMREVSGMALAYGPPAPQAPHRLGVANQG